jgi:hypothetical protein
MPDRTRRRHRIPLAWPLIVATLVFAALAPGTARGGGAGSDDTGIARNGDEVALLAPPPETCEPGESRAAGDISDICGEGSGVGGGGVNLGGLVPILAIVVVGGVIALIAAFVVLRRTSAPLVPADPGEWWTCRTCGKSNVVGSARCYACGAWQR